MHAIAIAIAIAESDSFKRNRYLVAFDNTMRNVYATTSIELRNTCIKEVMNKD